MVFGKKRMYEHRKCEDDKIGKTQKQRHEEQTSFILKKEMHSTCDSQEQYLAPLRWKDISKLRDKDFDCNNRPHADTTGV
jgi:hypothetical protein